MKLPAVPTISNPKGIDAKIAGLQSFLNTELATSDYYTTAYKCYARAYLNQREGGVIPELYIGSKEYVDLRLDDREAAFSFFVVDGGVPVDGDNYNANVRLITYINLSTVYSGVSHRADENAHRDIHNAINGYGGEWEITGQTWGIENVYEGFEISERMYDMQPFHVFAIQMEVPYFYGYGTCSD